GEHALRVGWGRFVPGGDEVTGRSRLPCRNAHDVVEGRGSERLLHGIHDPGPRRVDVGGEVAGEVVLWQPYEPAVVDDLVRESRRHGPLREQPAERLALVEGDAAM